MGERTANLDILLLRSYTPLRRRVFRPSAVTLREVPDSKVEIDCPKVKQVFPDFFYKDTLVMVDHRRDSLWLSHRPRPKPIVSVRKRLLCDRLAEARLQFEITIVRMKPNDPRDRLMFPGFEIRCDFCRITGETTQTELRWTKILPPNQLHDAAARFVSMLMDILLDKKDSEGIQISLDNVTSRQVP